MKRFNVGLWLGAAALCALLAGCSKPPPLPVYWQLPAFQLTAQNGKPFGSQALEGDVWVADFIYTTCTSSCPRMSALMHSVQSAVSNLPDVKLVSITVDPAHDTPPVLADYARRYRAAPGRWFFLTGGRAELQAIYRNGFKLGDVNSSLAHSTRFMLVDRRLRVRGIYTTGDDGVILHVVRDIRALRAEKS
jgi:protein SCO1